MREVVLLLLPVVLGMQLFGIPCLVVGWLLAVDLPAEVGEAVTQPVIAPVLAQWFREPFADWSLANAAPHKHVTAMGKSDNEGGPIGPDPTPEPERVVALRPMSALERLEGPTRRIIRSSDGYEVRPWWHGGRHRTPDSRCRVPKFLDSPQATAEFPEIGRHRSGEYPVLGKVSG